MRLSQSFETQEKKFKHAVKKRKHSPNFDNVTWDKVGILETLTNWNSGEVNWTKQFNVPGGNQGQIVKEFASENGIDVTKLDGRLPNTRTRSRKLRLPGGEISVPTHPTMEEIKTDWDKMIENGELSLGEPCHPQKICRISINDGELHKTEHVVYGRKIPLLELRKKLLLKHESLMHLHTDNEIARQTNTEVRELLTKRKVTVTDLSDNILKDLLKKTERTRTIGFWHDHSTILGHGYVLVTVKVFYDSAVFKTELSKPNAFGVATTFYWVHS